jgi:hypothetical protein
MTIPWQQLDVPTELTQLLQAAPRVVVPKHREELLDLALGSKDNDRLEIAYDVPGKGRVVEAEVVRAKNGVVLNYMEPYMRRRDPDCMVIADDRDTDKPLYQDRFGRPFAPVRNEIFDWLAKQELILLPFLAGSDELGYSAALVVPINAAVFAAALADLQGMVESSAWDGFKPRAIIYIAPPFRHTHYDGKQVAIHNRLPDLHEIFALNLYPGPSAKKGVYGVLLTIGSAEGWITAHGSTVQVVTPYDNVITILHEGASGGGKSEMLEYAHRQPDGRLLLGKNLVNDDEIKITLPRGCDLHPVTDDMALCHPEESKESGRLVVSDAEDAWFLRINHIDAYGTDPNLESLCTQPSEPIVFINLYGVPRATCLIWEHIEDEPGKPCPNPRVIVPRRMVPRIVNDPVAVDYRSFGVRTPPCTSDKPTYGIVGMLHILPPALAWLWRLVAPRGFANPSITDSEALESEGVGSYWPFATGRRTVHANLLLNQIVSTPRVRYTLCPNQHIGAWRVGFMAQWVTREYLGRRGMARFREEQLTPARCSLLGHALTYMLVEGVQMPEGFLQVNKQPEVGNKAYDAGAKQLTDFFARELKPYLDESDLDPLGRKIIECFLNNSSVTAFETLIPAPSHR